MRSSRSLRHQLRVALGNVAPLPCHVSVVLGGSPQEEMRGPHTGRVVAVVTDVHPFRDGAARYRPGIAMSAYLQPGAVGELAIATNIRASRPDPARPQLRTVRRCRPVAIDLRPEARLGGCSPQGVAGSSSARLTTKSPLPSIDLAGPCDEGGGAPLTGTGDGGTLWMHQVSPIPGARPRSCRKQGGASSCQLYPIPEAA